MKKKATELTTPLYTYVKPKNRAYVRREAKAQDLSYSQYVDNLIERSRTKKTERVGKRAA